MQCFYNFKKDTFEKQIIVLKPNYEFLIWELQIDMGKYIPKDLNPFFLFYDHYTKAMNHSQKKSNMYKKFKSEIIKAWNNADEEVRIKYNELASLLINLMQIYNLGIYKEIFFLYLFFFKKKLIRCFFNRVEFFYENLFQTRS
jgi:hypothetical protein